MNKVLSAQVKAVQKHGGMVDKFIGDAGMYIFNAPLDMLHHPKIAVECAIDIIKNVGEVNLELVAEGFAVCSHWLWGQYGRSNYWKHGKLSTL
jgi:adenylate cyclase